jgi:hypothetical protein
VEFREGETRDSFVPHRIKSYRFNEGDVVQGANQTFVVQLGGQLGIHYLKDQPITQEIDTELVESSLAHTIASAKTLEHLLKKKAEYQVALATELTHIETDRSGMLAHTTSIGSELANLLKSHAEVAEHRLHEGRYGGMYEWLIHQRALWKMEPHDGGVWGDCERKREAEKALARTSNANAEATAKKIGGSLSTLETALAIAVEPDGLDNHKPTIKRCTERVQKLLKEMADLDQQILAAARR